MTRTESLALMRSPVSISHRYCCHCLLWVTLGKSLTLCTMELLLRKVGVNETAEKCLAPRKSSLNTAIEP